MKEEFLELVNKWHSSFMFSAHGSVDPAAKEHYNKLREWCINNRDVALSYIREILLQGPDDIVILLDDLYHDDKTIVEGFCPLDEYCNLWLNILHNTKGINYYKDHNEWSNYLKDNYIPWDPRIEGNPNVTLKEFKQGKRNDKKLIKK